MRWQFWLLMVMMISANPCGLLAQVRSDTTKSTATSLTKKAYRQGLKYITTNKKDTIVNETSVDVNKIYEGKIIRHVYVEHIGFERSIYDSTKRTKKFIADAANALHSNTKENIIRQHLFLKSNKPLNPLQLSDNERYIRDLDFILDCRIVVVPLPDQPDSVDLSVVTKDVFSLGVTLGGTIPTAPKIGVYDANLGGLGQRLSFTGLIDPDLKPMFTSAAYYRKSSLLGSLTNIELGYTQLNSGVSLADEIEYAYYLRATRPLVSPYARFAGGLEFSNNWSKNVEQKPDSVFLKYKYKVSDVWLGLNFGTRLKATNRNRIFLAARFFDGAFASQPDQPQYSEEIRYNSGGAYLSELTFYRQNFYRTRYVFGFGLTEDVPYGMSLSVSTGYVTQVGLERPYSAAKFSYSVANRQGNFYTLSLQAGAYARKEKIEDGVITANISYATRLVNLGDYKMRGFIVAGYGAMLDRKLLLPMQINKTDLLAFSADSVWGNHKAALRIEPTLYTPWQLIGFRFAPFFGGGMAWLDCTTCLNRDALFYQITGGVRTRNENLIFGTMEFRFTYIPATDDSRSKLAFGFKQRLTFKNSGTFVKPPSLVSY